MIWLEIIEEAVQWFLIITLLGVCKMHDDKIETLYKSANTFLEGYLKFIRGKKNEHSDNTRQTNA